VAVFFMTARSSRSTEAGVKQQLIQQQSGQVPMYHLELPDINANHMTEGWDDTAVRFRALPRARQLSIDRQTADLAGRAFELLLVLIKAPGAGLDTPLHQPAAIRETTLRVGPLELDLLQRTARRGDRPIQLLPREFRLLEYMMRRRNEVLSRAMLLKEIWNYKFIPKTNLVDVHMGRLRRKVDEPHEAPMIKNVRGVGFILRAPT
jgi:DNA-binding winged helix-turn-helix (wHTH) protein